MKSIRLLMCMLSIVCSILTVNTYVIFGEDDIESSILDTTTTDYNDSQDDSVNSSDSELIPLLISCAIFGSTIAVVYSGKSR